MLFEILCAGGCGADPEPIILFFEKVIQLCRLFVPLIILTIGIIKVVKYRKGTKNKERRKARKTRRMATWHAATTCEAVNCLS